MKIIRYVIGSVFVLICTSSVHASGQNGLPPEARMQILIAQTETALAKGEESEALNRLAEMSAIDGVERPARTYMLEARLANRASLFDRATKALEGYFRTATTSEPDYEEAARLYAAVEDLKAETERQRLAAETADDEAAWLAVSKAASCAGIEGYLLGNTVRNFTGLALDTADKLGCNTSTSPLAAQAATNGLPIDKREFADEFTSGSGRGPQMIAVPSGSFTMGSPSSGETGRSDEAGPQRTVAISYEFAVGKYEVTWTEYSACVSEGACPAAKDDGFGKGNRPVTNVGWEDAKKYTSWLSGKTGKTYRLLTEAEWEYAARAGTKTPFSFGSTISTSQANYDGNYTYGSGSKGVYRRKSTPVDTFEANAFGLHDMHGNVWEWVEDCHEAGYSVQPSDGSAYLASDCSYRVIRGGSWSNLPQNLRSAHRLRDVPGSRNSITGFRIARAFP